MSVGTKDNKIYFMYLDSRDPMKDFEYFPRLDSKSGDG